MALPNLPAQGQNPWYIPRTAWDDAVESELEGRLSETGLSDTITSLTSPFFAPAEVVPTPSGFAFTSLTLPTVWRLGGAKFSCDLSGIAALRPNAGVTYYVSPGGSDANTGLTPASPITIPGAYGKSDVGTIACLGGEYFRNTHFLTTTWTKNINLIAVEPGVKITGWNSPSSTVWTLQSGSIYKTSRSGTTQVIDVINRTAWQDSTVYQQVADLASITSAGQWAIVGSDVYVWAIGNTNLTVIANRFQIRLGIGSVRTGVDAAGSAVIYVRGIDFEGNELGGVNLSDNALIIMEDCSIKYRRADGVVVTGGRGIVSSRCVVSSNGADGLSYSHNSGTRPNVIEVDVKSYHNGAYVGATTNNNSTAHADLLVLRVNGYYDVSGGPVVADVNSAKSWNLGCRSGGSTAADPQRQSYRADATGFESVPVEMWLDECEAFNNLHAYKVTGGGKIHVHRPTILTTNVSDVTSGVVDMYIPA